MKIMGNTSGPYFLNTIERNQMQDVKYFVTKKILYVS